MRTVYAAATVLALTASASHAAVLFSEDFSSYPGSTALVGQNGWSERSAGVNPITATNGSVTLASTGQDIVKAVSPAISFDPTVNPAVASGYAFYLASDVTVTTAKTGDYILHTSGSTTSSSFQSRLYIKAQDSGFVFGTGVTSATPAYGSTVLELNQPYRVVIRYDMISGASNDDVQLYIFPLSQSLPTVEPATSYATITQSGSGDASGLGSVNLRQGATASGPIATLDNIVIADSFAQAVAVPEPSSLAALALAVTAASVRRRRTR